MTPIHELLARIRWDPAFGAGRFEIGYHDRTTGTEVRLPFDHLRFEPGNEFGFDAITDDGDVHAVPYHRVRSVWRNGERIWHRHEPPA